MIILAAINERLERRPYAGIRADSDPEFGSAAPCQPDPYFWNNCGARVIKCRLLFGELPAGVVVMSSERKQRLGDTLAGTIGDQETLSEPSIHVRALGKSGE